MTDALVLEERVRNTIQLGESHFREFKAALEGPPGSKRARPVRRICSDIAEALVAFANADGGELLIGVDDDGAVTGVPHSEADVTEMLAAPTTHVHRSAALPLTSATRLSLDGKAVLFFSVTKGSTEIYLLSDGRCVRRRDRASVPEAPKTIVFARQEVRSREFDRQFVDGATVADLDVPYLQSLADSYLRGLSVERYLQQIGIAEYGGSGLRLRMAALLLFAREIRRWHPRSQVRILRVAGVELLSGEQYNVTLDESIEGNIFELLVKVWEKLRSELTYKTEFGADARFEQRYLYPELACREALVNAIAHRDYSVQNGIDIFIFSDRMEIRSPGELLSTLSIADIEQLKGAHESRNALIARVLRENKFMRELGEGMKRIFELMEQSELLRPRLESTAGIFNVSLTNRSVFDSRQEQWLAMFRPRNLTALQKRIIVAGIDQNELSSADLYRAMNIEDRNTYDREVTGLRMSKILTESKSQWQAMNHARKMSIPKRDVPRFRVQVPPPETETTPTVSSDVTPECVVFVRNVGKEARIQAITELFARCGTVERIDLPVDGKGAPKGFCYVHFTEAVGAAKALNMHGSQFLGRLLDVRPYRPK